MSETKEPKTETTPLGAVGPKRGRRRGRQPENQKLPAEVAKAGRMLSPERMRIVLDSLTEVPILYHAATKAGIHRKTLEYWLRRSAAGDAGYDIEWQGIEWRFHEHCTSAIDEADDSLRAVMWQNAMGVVSKTDENGNFILEACGQPNMKMARHFLEWQRPEKWGKRRKGTSSTELYMDLHFVGTANVFVYYPYLKKARSEPARYVHGSAARQVDGIFIVQLNCPHTSMPLPLKT